MNIMTKRGNSDNVVTYEHICDTMADRDNIEPQYVTLGSICIVIMGESGGLEAFIADSSGQWHALFTSDDSGSSDATSDVVDVGQVDSMTLNS